MDLGFNLGERDYILVSSNVNQMVGYHELAVNQAVVGNQVRTQAKKQSDKGQIWVLRVKRTEGRTSTKRTQ